MINVHIAYEVSDKAFAKIKNHLERTQREDVDFNGAEFSLVRDEFTHISESTVDAYDTDRLFYAIQNIVQESGS